MGLRPMLYYYADGEQVTGCGAASCVKAVMLIGTPAMWWLAPTDVGVGDLADVRTAGTGDTPWS